MAGCGPVALVVAGAVVSWCSGRRIGMEQARARVTNRDDASVQNQAPCAVVALRSGFGLGARKVTAIEARAMTPATIRAQRGPRPDTE